MNTELLNRHISQFINYLMTNPQKATEEYNERLEAVSYYQGYTHERIIGMTEEEIYEYISKLWAMLIWGNKHYVVDKLIADNGFENFKLQLAALVWGSEPVERRWDSFRKTIKGMGPAMMSEILCKTHPDKYMLWNRRAYNGLNVLQVPNLPVYNYQVTGKRYRELCDVVAIIAGRMKDEGFKDPTLLAADYFLWHEFPADNLNEVYAAPAQNAQPVAEAGEEEKEFIHNEVRDAIRNIGQFLGFEASIEKLVAEGSRVDALWESKIGNMGRVIYVFEVQTHGSIDSLLINLQQTLNNAAVQGVVAVSARSSTR
jgi:hypothetical protein